MSGKSRTRPRVGLFIQGGAYAYQSGIIFGAHEECVDRDLDFYCFAGGTLARDDPRSTVYRIAGPRDLDAVILVPGTWGTTPDDPHSTELVDRYATTTSCVLGARYRDLPSVRVDNSSGVKDMTTHLIEAHGKRRIGFIAGHGFESAERQSGYEEALRNAGIPFDPHLVYPGDFLGASGAAAVARWFRPNNFMCDALVAANDWMAIGAMEALHARQVRVPEDVALVGFDDVEQASFTSPPLTTIRQPPRLLGKKAVALVDRLRTEPGGDVHLFVPTVPQIRQSCGCFSSSVVGQAGVRLSTLPKATSLSGAGPEVIRAVEEAGNALSEWLPPDWARSLWNAFVTAFESGTDLRFLEELGSLLGASAPYGNVTSWHHVVARLRKASIGYVAPDGLLVAEALFRHAHIMIGDRAERTQAERLIEREQTAQRLEEAALDARVAVDIFALRDALVRHLPRLGVPTGYVALTDADDPSRATLRMVIDSRRGMALTTKPFSSGDLIPTPFRPEARHSMMVAALFARETAVGFCCLEIGPYHGGVYQALADVMGASLRAIQLADALVEEATRRERADQARLEQELEIAARIQTAILPRRFRVGGLEIAAKMIPATEVGGDFFDVHPFAGGAWLAIGDVAGHGLNTGLIMMMMQSVFAAATKADAGASPLQAWQTVNAVLCENVRERLGRDEHSTLTLLRYEEDGRVVFAGAHEDLLIYRPHSGRAELVPTPGIWAGIRVQVPPSALSQGECRLEPGDILLLHTDGITEARSPSGELFGIDRLANLLVELGREPVGVIVERVLAEVRNWAPAPEDDQTILVARYLGLEEPPKTTRDDENASRTPV
jgi:DNA-binding LacI/PurR family transcriptional regulator/serine phosphatase RsbU (regulator of sigma subunit)